MIGPLVSLALDYYRDPLAYGHLADGAYPLPRGFSEYFSDLCLALSPKHIETTARRLASSPEELEMATRFFARHVLLDPSASWYRCLGVSRRASSSVIHEHYRFLIKLFHPDRLPDATAADLTCSMRVNAAYEVLGDPKKRARYDRMLRNGSEPVVHSDPRDFFGPHDVRLSGLSRVPWWSRARKTRLLAVVLVVGAVLFGSGALLVLKPQPDRALRLVEDAGNVPVQPSPSYLRRHGTRDDVDDATAASQSRTVP